MMKSDKSMLLNREIQNYFCNKTILKLLDNELKKIALSSFNYNGMEKFLKKYYEIWEKKQEIVNKITKFNTKISNLTNDEKHLLNEYFAKNRTAIDISREKNFSLRIFFHKISRIADKIISC